MSEGRYDKRNKLNDLTGKEWLKLTKSFWFSEKCDLDLDAFNHPAPFLVQDIKKLISMFTKKGMLVLDPFCGSGTTLIASAQLGRNSIGIDLNDKYKLLAVERLSKLGFKASNDYNYYVGDSFLILPELDSVDYIVTSPPYHNILRNKGEGLRKPQGNDYRNGSRLGVKYYSERDADLGNLDSFDEFVNKLQEIMNLGYKILNKGKYCTIIMSDFTVNKKEKCVLGRIVDSMEEIGFEFSGTTVLLQDNKPLYPFGYPYAYVINHHHQNLITFRKPK